MKKTATRTKVYQLKITLKNIKPPIWRRLLVPDCTLDDLHEMIQVAMGWDNYHLYAFSIAGQEFTRPDMDDGELNMADATATWLTDVIGHEKQKFKYEYDFGDSWDHEILVEAIGEAEAGQQYPVCVTGKRACPPEDVGGAWGYVEFCQAMADPKHKRHKEFVEWCGERDPEAFDPEEVNAMLRGIST